MQCINETYYGINLPDEKDYEIIARQILAWFNNCQYINWLLIIDNAEELETVVLNQNEKTDMKLIFKFDTKRSKQLCFNY